jgi:UDP-3-O-[3-hydroxymyristoyl] glucosamine N-acyltransferase
MPDILNAGARPPLPVARTETAAELVSALARPARIVGDATRRIRCVAPLEALCAGALSFSKLPAAGLGAAAARPIDAVVIAPLDGADDSAAVDHAALTLIKVAAPRAYFIHAVRRLVGGERFPAPSRSPAAIVAPDARIEPETHLAAGVVVGHRAVIGRGCVLFGGVQVHDDVVLGEATIVQSNAVIGSHGQAYVRDDDGTILAFPHLGRVLIGARVRIGANTTIVRGTLRDTVVGDDTSVGNNVNIGHNVVVGARCFIGAGVVLNGSSLVGDDTWLSAGAVVRGVAIGSRVTVGVGAVVTRPVPDGKTANGFPARVTATEL